MKHFGRKSPLSPLEGEHLSENRLADIETARAKRVNSLTATELGAMDILQKLRTDFGIWFNIQQPMAISSEIIYWVDFWLPRLRIVVEIDGPEHKQKANKLKDRFRAKLIRGKRLKILRFTNSEVRKMPADVATRILRNCMQFGNKDGRRLLGKAFVAKNGGIRKGNWIEDVLKAYAEANWPG